MGIDVSVIKRKARVISGETIHVAKYAFKAGGSFDRMDELHRKYTAPTERSWEKAGESPRDALFVMDWDLTGAYGIPARKPYEDGADVYRWPNRTATAYEVTDQVPVGKLIADERNRLRFVPAAIKQEA